MSKRCMRQSARGWAAATWALAAAMAAHAQPRPDAGSLQEPQRQIPALPAPGGPPLQLPRVATPPPAAATTRLVPAGFRVEGNTVFDSATLLALLADRVNQPTDLAGLQQAARRIKTYYQERGHLLTEVYLPEQALAAEGGIVTLAVIEARVGKVTVRTQGRAASQARSQALVARSLPDGAPITEYGLDLPVLLLRDLSGYDASATVEPGERRGEANVIIDVRAGERQVESSAGLDNHGTPAAGTLRAFATVDVHNPQGGGESLSARIQVAQQQGTHLFRLAYTFSPGAVRSRLSLAATRSEYALGRQFAALGATGRADILSALLLHPFIRSRSRNLYGSLAIEHKQLNDKLAAFAASERRIVAARLGLLGNFLDEAGDGVFTSYAASATLGHLRLDSASTAADQAPGGAHTAGQFAKFNLELQRIQFLPGAISLVATLQSQAASRNLASAEKMSLGGPAGVRGYPVGEAVGDSGALLSLELRYPLPARLRLAGEGASLSAFYDAGTVRFNQEGMAGDTNHRSLSSAGVGLLAGRSGRYLINMSVAARISSSLPSGGGSVPSARFWLTTQTWF